ncbi:MAG TPA: ATP-binding protein [Vicinamibacteria bacterium]|nr:ATP-binding protein [Vicinamibacteria bacterium]
MKSSASRTVRLDIASRLDLLEVVQTVLNHLSGQVGFDEEAVHYMSVALRESVVNAIKHGNQGDESKRVAVEFVLHAGALEFRVQDEGTGFDPRRVANPVEPENLLRPDGRGIFFMRNFMDVVEYSFPPKGGTVVRMMKKLAR